jgi:GNAT superfamily N-acetyltransferase
MNLKNKLKDIPTIYYTNLDRRTDRREYMETQFDYWGIKDYHRISSSKYLSTEDYKWEHLVLDKSLSFGSAAVANSITQLEMIKNWLETTNDEYLIMMEDDYDLSLIEYWNFDWEYLINNIPENWDCIQLGFENGEIIPFFLHPVHRNHGFGPCLINRDYAKKLIKLHCIGNKFKLNIRTNDIKYRKIYGMVDSFILEGGKTYSIPLITNNPDLGSDYDLAGHARGNHEECRNLYYNWWKNEHHKFSLEEFFNYGKPNDYQMIRNVNYKKEIKKKINYS